jgi:hypothetical protein
LANDVCWVFSVEGVDHYVLIPRDPASMDSLIDAAKQCASTTKDVAVVIGTMGPVCGPDMCNGLQLRIVGFDVIWHFDQAGFIKAIPRPDNVSDADFGKLASDLLDRIAKMSDNAGATDEHRAINYLALTYPGIYGVVGDQHRIGYDLSGLSFAQSRLGGATRKILDVLLTFTNRVTTATNMFHVRVDVTDKYPFLVTPLSPYYDVER